MWNYEKRLQFPVKINKCNPKIAQQIISQYGGAYISSRSYSSPILRALRTYRDGFLFCRIQYGLQHFSSYFPFLHNQPNRLL